MTVRFFDDDPPVLGDGNIVEINQTARTFDRVELSRSITANLQITDARRITLKTDQNLIDQIDIRIEQGVLKIKSERAMQPTLLELTLQTPQPHLRQSLRRQRAPTSMGLREDTFALDVSGGSVVSLSGAAPDLAISASGGSATCQQRQT